MKKLITCLAVIACLTSCKPGKETSEKAHLGTLEFTASSNSEKAKQHFNEGILLLHSFEYSDAAEAFRLAQDADKDMAMAYWGEAMTYNHPLWQEQNIEQGRATLNRLATNADERKQKCQTEIEKDFMHGVDMLYGEGNKAERDSTYAAYMGGLYKKYKGNNEVAAFYSLALNGWGTVVKDTAVFRQAAQIGLEVKARNPQHPGALHYVIHAYDNPWFAKEALATADKYALVAPDAGHALHMPTHTYLALGLWDKVVSSNIVSWHAELARKQRKQLDNDALGYHAYHWLQYGHLQQGRTELAKLMLDSMVMFCTGKPSFKARNHVLLLKSSYLGESADYNADVVNITVPDKDINISLRATSAFAKGMHAYKNKQADAMRKVLEKMAGDRLIEEEKAAVSGVRLCGSINRGMATASDIADAHIMELELKAMLALLESNKQEAERYFKLATNAQTANGYSYGPPAISKASYELYGEWLLSENRFADAKAVYEEGLQLMPNKRLLVHGLEQAKRGLGSTAFLK